MTDRRAHTVGLALMAFALILRLAALYVHPVTRTLVSDMGNYAAIADDLLHGVWKPTAFFQPIGFSYLVYLCKRLTPDWGTTLGLIHLAASTATVWLVWKSAERAFGARAGLIALAVAAVHVPWILFTALTLSETTYTFLLAVLVRVGLAVVERPSVQRSALWGLVFIAAFWLKGTHVLLGPLFLLGILTWKRGSREAVLTIALPLSTVVAAGLLLHGVLTYRTIGTVQLSASAGGLNFVEGKCPSKHNFDSAGASWISPIYVQLGQTSSKIWDRPFTDSGYFMKEGAKCIRDNPLVLVQSLESIPFLFIGNYLWPASELAVAPLVRLYELCFAPLLLAGLLAWARSHWPPRREASAELVVWALPVVALCACVYIFKSEVRFRVPFDVWFIPIAAQGWVLLSTLARPRKADARASASR